jgi:hypothetical protein
MKYYTAPMEDDRGLYAVVERWKLMLYQLMGSKRSLKAHVTETAESGDRAFGIVTGKLTDMALQKTLADGEQKGFESPLTRSLYESVNHAKPAHIYGPDDEAELRRFLLWKD